MSTRLIRGDCREVLPTLEANSFDCCVTSPPYFGLRDYGTASWEGGDASCEHIVGEIRTGLGLAKLGEQYRGGGHKQSEPKPMTARGECPHCGARRVDAQIGLEPTLDAYVETMRDVFREVRRVLKPSGTCWLNLGDSYSMSTKGSSGKGDKQGRNAGTILADRRWAIHPGLKPKDLCFVPHRVAMALQADGWWVRSATVWHKPNPMPESVTDRPTSAYEMVFLLTKKADYYYDSEAIAEERTSDEDGASFRGDCYVGGAIDNNTMGKRQVVGNKRVYPAGKRNARNVWTIATQPFSGWTYDFEGSDYVDDHGIPRKLSQDCPVHGQRKQLRLEIPEDASGDEPSDHSSNRKRNGSYLAQGLVPAVSPIDCRTGTQPQDNLSSSMQCGIPASKTRGLPLDTGGNRRSSRNEGIQPAPVLSTMDCEAREDCPTAISSSIQSHRTGLAPPFGQRDLASEEIVSDRRRTEPSLVASAPLDGRSDASRSEEPQLFEHETLNALFHPPRRTSHKQSGKSSNNDKCSCRISQTSHFATMPPALAERCIKAGCPAGGHVLDPFGGSGTTGLVADRLGRDATLIELGYDGMAEDRIVGDSPLFAEVVSA